MRRLRGDEGAYAILYAVLVVVLLGMGALVVDIAMLRADKRDSRSAADFASLAGASRLGPGPWSPVPACEDALDNASATLGVSLPTASCGLTFGNGTTPPTPFNSCPSATMTATATTADGNITVTISWPVPSDSAFITSPDGLGEGEPQRAFNTDFDGSAAGCDRLAVDVRRVRDFGLANAIGFARGTSTSRSLARFIVKPGGNPEVAALNVLSRTGCSTLSTGGQGDVLVNRAIDSRDPTKFGQGIIAIESDGSTCGQGTVLDVLSNDLNRVCASGASQVPDLAGTCDGNGLILMHALDPGGQKAYPTPLSSYPISPQPRAENGISQWKPVSDIYGCHGLPNRSIPPISCASITPNYMETLYSAYATGISAPTTTYTGVGAYTGVDHGAFKTLPGPDLPAFTCSPDNLYIPAGNWFINCPDGPQAGFALQKNNSVVVFGGGHIVFQGGIDAAKNGGCLAFNVPLSPAPPPGSLTCPATLNLQSSVATTVPAPVQEAIVLSRGNRSISNGSSSVTLLMPQTLIVQTGGGGLNLGGGTGTVLWSAPGAGTRNSGVSTLSALCSAADNCLNSHFEKISYWNERNPLCTIGGQGSVTYVGVFFAPIAPFEFKGQGGGAGTNAQFWADTLTLSGQAKLYLTPDAALAVPRPVYGVGLIR